MNALDWIARILVIIGALNWGLVGVGVGDLVDLIFGGIPILATIVYVLVGLGGIWELIKLFKK